ncbi:hypothetical protein ACEPAH_2681 [Sanghuangporus vaninii]
MGRTKSSTPPLSDPTDPFSRLLAPPPDESPEARAARHKREADAKKRSDEIDARLAAESAARRKKGAPIKVLLLGQSESGKSTTLKNFQLTYARKQWLAEKEAWRVVIQLNLVRSVNTIASAVARELPSSSNAGELEPEPENAMDAETASILTLPDVEAEQQDIEEESTKFPLTEEHRNLLLRLAPLKAVQRNLEVKLGSGAEEIGYNDNDDESENAVVDPSDPARKHNHPNSRSSATGTGTGTGSNTNTVSFKDITNAASTPSTSTPASTAPLPQPSLRTRKSHQEFFVRSYGWKSALQRLRPRGSRSSKDELGAGDGDDPDSVAIARAAGDMKALWRDKVVREAIRVRKIRLMDCAEFFLNDIDRVCAQRYVPSDDDIIRARLRTVGVQEHTLTLESSADSNNRTWIIYDVGGSRTQRAQWPAYFDDVHAIIFLAPLSAFDERLAEAPRVNRLDDSMQLWKLVCSNKLLARAELVLFLNKVDLLERKLASGVRFGEYVRSYRDGENEVGAVGKFLRGKFMEVCRHYSKEHRGLHVHFTSVIDTQATAKTLAAVQDGILRSNLRHLDLI